MRAFLLVLAVPLVACTAHHAGRSKGMEPALTTAEALSSTLDPRRRAILVGVDDYDDPVFPDLLHAEHDATELGEVLAAPEQGGFDDLIVLTGAQSSRERIVRALIEARDEMRREDTLLVYFSGHGTGVEEDGRWRRFLLPRDGRAADLEGTAIELDVLQQFVNSLPAERKALIVDACFSGDGKSVLRPGAKPESQEPPFLRNLALLGPGEAHLYATSPGRPSREDDRGGRSYAVDVLARMAQGPSHALGVRMVGIASTPLARSIGAGALGVEAWGLTRAGRGPRRGLYGEWSLAAAVSPARMSGAESVEDGRVLGWGSLSGGYQGDLRRFRLRAGWGISAALIPPDWIGGNQPADADPMDYPSEAGWTLWATGPTLGAGVVLREGGCSRARSGRTRPGSTCRATGRSGWYHG